VFTKFHSCVPHYVYCTAFPAQYAVKRILFVKGKGVYLFDKSRNRYLDFSSGIAVNAIGYGRKDLSDIISIQMRKLIHISNLYLTEPAMELAHVLLSIPFSSKKYQVVHFGNSGTEANEAAIKYARTYAKTIKGPDSYQIISFHHSFHGRTMGALSTSNREKDEEKFGPLLPGCISIPYNDIQQLYDHANNTTAAIIVEGIQGEGGLRTMTKKFAHALNTVAQRHNIILIADEVQTGLGRCAAVSASSLLDLAPDIITLAKPLAAGLPLSATLLTGKINAILEQGDHGSTFGGGPAITAVALAVVHKIYNKRFLQTLKKKSRILDEQLQKLLSSPGVKELRGIGFLRGIVLHDAIPVSRIIQRALEHGLVVLQSGKNVVRIAPPLVISPKLLAQGVAILHRVIGLCTKEYLKEKI